MIIIKIYSCSKLVMGIREIVAEKFNLNVKNLGAKPLKGVFRGIRVIGPLLSFNPPGWQGQVKGSDCQCLLMGPAEGSDSRVISVMMMSYCFP